MAALHKLSSEWLSKHDTKPPAAQSSEDSTVITTEHTADASGKSKKRKAAEALLNKMHLAADSRDQKRQRQEAFVVSHCCLIVPWAVSIKLKPVLADQQCLSSAGLYLCASLSTGRQPGCMVADALRSANTRLGPAHPAGATGGCSTHTARVACC